MQAIKTAIITGASSGGIGYEIGLKCLQQGFRVVLSDNDSTSLATAKKDLAALGYGDDKVLYSETDVTNVEAMRKLKADAFKFGGNVDLLVLNAGIQVSLNFRKDTSRFDLKLNV